MCLGSLNLDARAPGLPYPSVEHTAGPRTWSATTRTWSTTGVARPTAASCRWERSQTPELYDAPQRHGRARLPGDQPRAIPRGNHVLSGLFAGNKRSAGVKSGT
jgi:hypothetical protein